MTFLIVAVTLAAVMVITRSNETMIARLSLYLPLEARHAADIYEREGKTGLRHHFDQIIESGSIAPYLFDENWKDVLGRNPPAGAVEFAKTAREDVPLISKFYRIERICRSTSDRSKWAKIHYAGCHARAIVC